ncbi:hypothetical protein GWD52_12435 [Enterobacteriaceae bacterium 4M9]|nr:hypothetical protein [Enterobacteriaceae bacterium 4M9]
MPKNLFSTLFLLAVGLFTSHAQAGCAEDNSAQCYYYKAGNLTSQSACQVTTCANVTSFLSNWEWENGNSISITIDPQAQRTLLNDKPAYFFPLETKNDLMCYGIINSDEMICTNSRAF